ncbi:hypothetical protein FRC08_014164 [Ceratobasidium sp. 394]|nr:hypothetical protein FRC08_014164 [Ceratobasidium sp. 394]
MTATQNAGRPPSVRQAPSLQVQVGPRPHDVLAQPQSPVSDVEDDFVAGGGAGLARAPTYHPRGQAHPGHARMINERQQQQQPQRRSMESNGSGGLSRNGSVDLPPFTAVAPSLEGPAYEEVMRTTTPANRRVTSPAPAPPPPVPSIPPVNERRQSGMEWKPMTARPQAQERVAGARQSAAGPGAVRQSTVAPAQSWTSSPSSYAPSPVTPAVPRPATAPAPAPAVAPAVAPRYGGFDPGLAYRSTQAYTLAGRADSSGSGTAEAQRALHEAGAHAFYNVAVASTLAKAPVFKAPPPPPPRTTTFGLGADDDVASVLSGRSGGGRQGSVYSGGAGARSSMYGAPPPGGIMAGGAPPPPPVPPMPAQGGYTPYQPGLGVQVPGAGGYQQGVGVNPQSQPGAYQPMGQAQAGGYQPQWAGSPGGVQQGGYQPQPTATSPGAYLPQSPGAQQPQLVGGLFGAGPGGYKPGQGTAGGYVPGQGAAGFAPPPPPGQFVAPPPPPGAPAPGKKPGKLYKRL